MPSKAIQCRRDKRGCAKLDLRMTKVETFLYTFVDEQTGELGDIMAPNESAARLWLGGDWIFSDRCPALAPPAGVGDWDLVVEDAQADAAAAKAVMMAAQPRGTATPEALRAFSEAVADHDRKRARVTKLIEMSVAASF